MRGMIIVDVNKCFGCLNCELACAVAHSQAKNLVGAIQEGAEPRVDVVAFGRKAIPLQCRHCEDAPCVAVCPTSALQKLQPQAPVLINQDLCIGCKSCMMVCPFGVISLGTKGKAIVKCDLCVERLAQGQEPACVEACPTGALTFGSIDEYLDAVRARAAAELTQAAEAQAKAGEGGLVAPAESGGGAG